MSSVELRNLAKSYGRKTVLRDVSLTVEPGDFMVVFGLPVSGKSVLVRLLTGLEHPDAGQVLLRGADATKMAAGARNIGYVPQSFALYPHYTVHDNIAYPLSLAKVPKVEIEPEVQRVAGLLGIADLLERKPDQLSGGQKQRVAIARGLIKRTDIYVLDDPLVGLDFKLRERLIDDLKRTQELLKVTFVYTTSDAVEALMLATNIGTLAHGEIVECGPPEELYGRPMRAETMRYVSFPQANFFAGSLVRDGNQLTAQTALFTVPVEAEDSLPVPAGAKIEIGLRPENVRLGGSPDQTSLTVQAKVLLREDLGGDEFVYMDVNGTQLVTVLRSDEAAQRHVEIDQMVTISMRPADLVIFADGRRVGHGKE